MKDIPYLFTELGIQIKDLTDEKIAKIFLSKFKPLLSSIGKRRNQLKKIPLSYDTPSVALFDQAKDLYSLGYFISALILCRSAAEYLAYEIFIEEVEIEGRREIIETVADNLDFRKIVNEFLYNKKQGYKVIDEITCKKFNEIYDLGNEWIHPKKRTKIVKIEDEAFKAIEITNELITSLRDVLNDYDLSQGKLVKKQTARRKIRPINLEKIRVL